MKPQKVRVGDFSEILGAITENNDYTCIASIPRAVTACGKTPKNLLMGYEFVLNCPDCLKELEFRGNNAWAKKKPFGIVTNTKENNPRD